MEERYKVITKHVATCHATVDKFINQYSNCCSEGCAYCCIQPIEIVDVEELPITDFIDNKMDDETKRKVRINVASWADYFNEFYNDVGDPEAVNKAFRELVDRDKVPCPFLIDNKCSIYPVRPLGCRAHVMRDTPNLCRQDGLREAPEEIKQIRDAFLMELTKIPPTSLRYLPVALAVPLGLGMIFKPHRIPRLS
ncbi:MAG: YkgJ family cysteine cluster protein [Carboxylicivirga sp.]|jgi:Fe-S-cluster containining protein|nr:YkgJ family cysteine cluster protein [Carboxylicivirga sp.]